MSLFSKLFGTRSKPSAETKQPAEDYNGFAITPTPIKEGARYRLSARIEKDGKVHTLIRADTVEDEATALTSSTAKAKRVIDEQGERIFG